MGLLEQKIGQLGLLIANIFLVILVDALHIETLVHIEIIQMAFFFYSFGYYVKRKKAKTGSNDSAVIQHTWILLGPATVIISALNTPVAMYENTYGNLFLFMLGAILEIAFVWELAKELESNTLLGWYGRNSLIIYVLHFGMIKVLHLLGKFVFPGIAQSNYGYPYNWIYFIAISILMIPIGYFCNTYIPFLFGKTTRK